MLKVTRDHFGRKIAYDQAEPDHSATLFKRICHLFEQCDPATQQEVLETLTDMIEAPEEQATTIGEDARRARDTRARTRRMGLDAASSPGFAQRFPSANRISVMPTESTHGNR
jgi:hypothetical protein